MHIDLSGRKDIVIGLARAGACVALLGRGQGRQREEQGGTRCRRRHR